MQSRIECLALKTTFPPMMLRERAEVRSSLVGRESCPDLNPLHRSNALQVPWLSPQLAQYTVACRSKFDPS
jgi:hypothetical protein